MMAVAVCHVVPRAAMLLALIRTTKHLMIIVVFIIFTVDQWWFSIKLVWR